MKNLMFVLTLGLVAGLVTGCANLLQEPEQRLAWYRFEKNLEDAAGDHHGRAVGELTFREGIGTQDGQYYAVASNGDANYIKLPADAYPRSGDGNGLERGTLCAWIKLAGSERQNLLGVINTEGHSNIDFQIPNHRGGMQLIMRDENRVMVRIESPPNILSPDQWYHIAITYDTVNDREAVMYLNGIEIAHTDLPVGFGDFATWQHSITLLGRNVRGQVDNFWNGKVDDLMVFGVPKTAEQIIQIYANGLGQPVIKNQTDSVRVYEGQPAELSVTVVGDFAVQYTWYKVVDGKDDVRVGNASVLRFDHTQRNVEGLYYCKVTYKGGAIVSDPIPLSIQRMLARFPFERNLIDIVHNTSAGITGPVAYDFGIVTEGDQQYAVMSDGIAKAIKLPDETAIPMPTGTIAAWIKTTADSSQSLMGVFNEGEHAAFDLQIPLSGDGTVRLFVRDDNGQSIALDSWPTEVNNGQWHHVAVAYDFAAGGSVRMYLNGRIIASTNVPDGLGPFSAWNYPTTLLARNVRGRIRDFMTGWLDDLMIFNYVKSDEDISLMYKSVVKKTQ
jgi:hypothetical protein